MEQTTQMMHLKQLAKWSNDLAHIMYDHVQPTTTYVQDFYKHMDTIKYEPQPQQHGAQWVQLNPATYKIFFFFF